ncbi:23S rRNA (pseudouridine(1915)-N(3))-methyltransferase RlmH [Sphingobium amiense]|uniref:Ribosomal RNA large subunit methyltransferase H n=1 Tax=Sphingobium amiense TaxID=135719 RepID=A0A494W6X4_9SPHN|nr:23S rRNA (pseudouridine(1915)-N(3))-methyltransferase RlmH [Sphingobium amiense]BBD99076.1 23S rRNA (pseudouridine(1915)-N(3))-methyltransferase RlmH [Sphingobium amiense]
MLLHIIARGKIGRSPEADLVDRYVKRLTMPYRITELPEGSGKGGGGRLPPAGPGTITVMLDEKGRQLSSMDFARRIEGWRDNGARECRFLIGAADGFDDTERASADLLIAFGAMTWPHMMARAMLAEQLWRACSILSGHPYHREG